jgi:beta-galactosidase
MNDSSVSRRRFLKQTSFGVAGLALTGGSWRVLAANDSGAKQPAASEGEQAVEGFEPVRYRPMAAKVTGLRTNALSLNGAWRLDPKPGQGVREQPLNAAGWGHFQVPGQWVQQGYDIPLDMPAALAREFSIPAKWIGYRIFLRFDAIHGGTHYWLNGKPLGYSENLFTPVEWEITEAAKFRSVNRLDLEMKVATVSERLSHSSGYTGYSLGGIDRAVRIYALPRLHVSSLRLNAGLDTTYQDGELQIVLGFDNPEQTAGNDFAAVIQLFDARGKKVEHSNPRVVLDQLHTGLSTVNIESRVAKPLKWNAEEPNLYRLVLTLEQAGRAMERIERHIGFRTVETKGRQLYVNGARVKLAGVCHHEIDPLTGRANTMRHAEEDVKLFKSANLNHVRTSHYPCTQEFLDAADRHGLYVESEAPLCWVQRAKDWADLKAVLTATSAMIDYNQAHPSVILWSLANESHWCRLFEESNKLCKRLDPTRPTTIEHAFTGEDQVTCDILSRHYQPMPYDEILKNDPRPFLHGECFFLVYHERTDVAINPGLRELWAAGSAVPDSAWGRACIENVKTASGLLPGIYPGAWSYICASEHCIGSEIWSGVDDIAFLPGGKVVSSENGNAYWGLIDGWRRPKPELELAKFVFSPVWFPVRQLDYKFGQAAVRVPVENRHSFTDLSRFDFVWELDGAQGKVRISVPPAAKGGIEIPVRPGTPEGAILPIRVMNGSHEIVNATLTLGQPMPAPLRQPQAGVPKWSDDVRLITIEGRRFSLVLDRTTGDFDAANPRHRAPVISFPSLHVTRHDFGDLDRKKPPYAEFPDVKTRVVESVTAVEVGGGLELTVKDRYDHFAGTVHWLMDKDGVGKISYDYAYTGDNLDTREIGIKTLLPAQCDEVKWRRWSEWGIFPQDSISRTEGTAKAKRDKKWPEQRANIKPEWPWSQDQTQLGTADFRSIKFHIYAASLVAPDGSGVQVEANADTHFRACLAAPGVWMHVLSQCPLAPVVLKKGTRLTGDFNVHLAAKGR